jgi:tRNA threonylcarbamoyl adenosine modification protein (Sua5/YciO/YrdC/YwlC family)
MMTPSATQIAQAAATLQRRGVVLLPTDTIYGLHALAGNADAVQRIVDIKGRGEDKPFVVIAASAAQLEHLGATLGARTRAILDDLWPGPFTAVVPIRQPIAASRGASTIAVRVPDLEWLRELLDRTGPLASTSANRSGEPPITDPKLISRDLRASIDGVVDAGVREGKPSTIVDFTGDEPRIIREGETFFTQKLWKTLWKTL